MINCCPLGYYFDRYAYVRLRSLAPLCSAYAEIDFFKSFIDLGVKEKSWTLGVNK